MTVNEFQSSYGSYNNELHDGVDGKCDAKAEANFKGFTRNVSYQGVFCMTPVQDQGNCTADWAIFTATNIADNYCLASGEWCALSSQQVLDCTPDSSGCRGGLWSASAARINWIKGIVREFEYPYEMKQGTCRYEKSRAIHQTVPWPKYPWKNENEMRDTIDKRNVFVISVDATNWQFITGDGVIGEGDPVECCRSDENRYVQVVGYGINVRGTPYWLVKNAWGTGWGDEGLARIIAGQNCYKLTRKFGYFPVKNEPGECTIPGPLPFTPPTPPPEETVVTNPTNAPTSAPETTTTVTEGAQSCGQQCGKWRLIWKILESLNSNGNACPIEP